MISQVYTGKAGATTKPVETNADPDKLLLASVDENEEIEGTGVLPDYTDEIESSEKTNEVEEIEETTDISEVEETTNSDLPVDETDPFGFLKDLYKQINPNQLEEVMLNNAKNLEFSSSNFLRDQGTYTRSLAPIFKSLIYSIQNNDKNGIYNSLSQALNLSSDLKLKRANNTGFKDLTERAKTEKNIYQNILNDPNMVNLNNPQAAFEFMTQMMMWTNGGSMPDYMSNLSSALGASTFFMDPTSVFSNYNY